MSGPGAIIGVAPVNLVLCPGSLPSSVPYPSEKTLSPGPSAKLLFVILSFISLAIEDTSYMLWWELILFTSVLLSIIRLMESFPCLCSHYYGCQSQINTLSCVHTHVWTHTQYRPTSLINIGTKIVNEYWHPEFKITPERTFVMTRLASFHS